MMLARLATLAGGLLLCASPAAAASDTTPAFAICTKAECRAPDSLDRAHVALGKDAVAYPGLRYATLLGFRPLTMDLYLPAKRGGKPLPVIVLIHGGGWLFGNPRSEAGFADLPKLLGEIAAQGFAVASVEYRFASEAPFPAALKDVKTSIRWLRAHSGEFGLDPDRFVTWGGSAGGQLSAIAATTCGVAKFEPDINPKGGWKPGAVLDAPPATVSDCVQGAVAWYGAFDFTQPIGGPFPIGQHPYFACKPEGCTQEELENPSAAHYLDAKDPPMLLVHGDADASAPPAQSRHFLELLKANGIEAELVMVPGADHGFRAATDEATLKAHQQALAASLAFTRKVTAR
ncbi:alpha/beta hydrolase fold domain-containing protein [Novosphingobium sp. BL-52-GroH]|uniref:alpha/beta hydrolase fold domain-containing protein n=1 Tax=Novosphingobium sp. BL-52-GroH TaxID=3349877 RepID=UPI00384F2078